MEMSSTKPAIFAVVSLHLAIIASAQVGPLPSLNIDLASITVSGFSSGGALAPQFHIAYSANVSGAVGWSGKPYLYKTDFACDHVPLECDITELVDKTVLLAASGQIDQTENMADDRVYLFHGAEDTTIDPEHSQNSKKVYQAFMPDSQIEIVDDIPALHAVVSDQYGSPCGAPSPIYVENCDFDSMFFALDFVLGGGLDPPSYDYDLANFLAFDQDIYYSLDGGDAFSSGMSSTGYIFVPPRCQSGQVPCRLHLYTHGCYMSAEAMGIESWQRMVAGLLAVGQTNDIVFLFPQMSPDFEIDACWNTAGYLDDAEGAKFATKEAPQMKGIFRMIEAIVG